MVVVVLIMRVMIKMVMVMITMIMVMIKMMMVMITMVMVMIKVMMASHSLGGLYGFLFVPFAVGELTKNLKNGPLAKIDRRAGPAL